MKRFTAVLSVLFLLACVCCFFFSCAEQEKTVQKKVIQIGEEENQECNEAVYKTRESRGQERTYLTTDFSWIAKPSSMDGFTTHFHNPPLRQYWTGTCWCFAATSLMESELMRLGKGEIKLSEMFTVYN